MYVNDAAIESWMELERVIDPPLNELMSQNGFDSATVDAWVTEMLENSVDDAGQFDRSHETQPKRIPRRA
ncbi:hypothetical protein BV900_19525 [Agrobacterium tumefaciens]|nr:hypothetical protein BV900_19525 [Agrobacterium tumefaciens]